MRTLKIFGWLSHFLWVTMLILCIFFGKVVYSEFVSEDQNIWLVKFLGSKISPEENIIYVKVFIIICYIIYLLYFYAVTLFNLCVRKFEKRIFFDLKIIKRFRKIGLIFITNFIIVFILGKLFEIHSEASVDGSTKFSKVILKELAAPLGGLIIGFFFLVLSQVFKEAKKQKEENIELKQENELTI